MTEPVKEIYTVSPPSGPWVITKSTPEGDLSFSPASEIPEVQDAIVAIGRSMVKKEDVTIPEDKIEFDLSKILAGQLDPASVIKGARLIKQDKHLPREVRETAKKLLEIDRGSNGDEDETSTMQAGVRVADKPKSAAVLNKEKKRQETEELQRIHEEARQNELDALKEWQKENPPLGKNYFVNAQGFVKTRSNTKGGTIILEDEGLDDYANNYVQELMDNPDLLLAEIRDTVLLEEFFAEIESPILSFILGHTTAKNTALWAAQYYKSPEAIKEAYQGWLAIFGSISKDFWFLAEDGEDIRDEMIEEDPSLAEEGILRVYGMDILVLSLAKNAEQQPENFIDLIHDLATQTIEAEDKYLTHNFFVLLARTINASDSVRAIIANTPIALGASDETKLKSVDIKLALLAMVGREEEKRHRYGRYGKKISKKLREQYDRCTEAAQENGIDFSRLGFVDKLYERTFSPLAQRVKEGELVNSVYLKLKHTDHQSTLS